MPKKPKKLVNTFQAMVKPNTGEAAFLDAWADDFSRIQRCLFDELFDKNIKHDKKRFMRNHSIASRQYNSMKASVDGIVESYFSNAENRIVDLEIKINNAREKIKGYDKKISKIKTSDGLNTEAIAKLKRARFGKRGRMHRLEEKLKEIQKRIQEGKPSICFGSKKLFHQQYHLEENSIKDHDQWKTMWQEARSAQFFVIGSKDETAGNSSCQITQNKSGLFDLKIKVPLRLVKQFGGSVTLTGIKIDYGKEHIEAAVADNQLRLEKAAQYRKDDSSQKVKQSFALADFGTALSYRFVRKKGKWYVFVSVEIPKQDICTSIKNGCIGVDLNADHLAVTETDKHGNPIKSWKVNLALYGKSTGQRKAIILDEVARLVDYAKMAKKPLAIEKLNFAHKKRFLEKENAQKARMLSSFAYSLILTAIYHKCLKTGVDCIRVNPAYTSVLGKIKYQKRYGISGHQAAALVIARRGQNFTDIVRAKNYFLFFNGRFYTRKFPERLLAGSLDVPCGAKLFSSYKNIGKCFGKAHAELRRCSGSITDETVRANQTVGAVEPAYS